MPDSAILQQVDGAKHVGAVNGYHAISDKPLASFILRFSPTDISQYLRLGRCERFLAIRLRERQGINVFAEYNVAPHPVAPLLRALGETFEAEVLERVSQAQPLIRCGEATEDGRTRGRDNTRIVAAAQTLAPGTTICFSQPAVATRFASDPSGNPVEIFGNIDLLRLTRTTTKTLQVQVVDVKRSAQARLDHYVQTALYALVIKELLRHVGEATSIDIGILRARQDAQEGDGGADVLFGCGEIAVFEPAPYSDAYRWAAEELVLPADSVVQRAAAAPVPEAPAHLNVRCDGCLNQEVCCHLANRNDDLCLLPSITARQKRLLRAEGIMTAQQFVDLEGESLQEVIAHLGTGYVTLLRQAHALHRTRRTRRDVDSKSSTSILTGASAVATTLEAEQA